MEITVMSRETIKPSSPTPHHLKHLKLSLIDQYMPPTVYVRMLLFHSAQGDPSRFHNTNMSNRLKASLSEVLTDFYPLAGTYKNNGIIECNDHGCEYIEAQVQTPLTLSQLLACPKAEELDWLFPHDAFTYETGFKGLFAAQVTVFEECGSMTVGVTISHVLADASSLAMFVNSWASITRGSANNAGSPKFCLASLFPPRDIPTKQLNDLPGNKEAGRLQPILITKRFVFNQTNINSLKAKYVSHCPTRVEAVITLIFKCLINMIKSGSIGLCLPINLRGRMHPPLPVNYFGNLALPCTMEHTSPNSLDDLGVQIRRLIKEIDSEYVKKLQADNASLLYQRCEQWWCREVQAMASKNYSPMFTITSWCKFPFYEADVGWGMPTWVTPVDLNHPDYIQLVDTPNGDGIEAWVTLHSHQMAIFEADHQLIDFSFSSDPIVCEL